MIEELLKKRSNITFFDKNKIPEEKVVKEILDKAQELTPHKNNFVHYGIGVYGPDQAEQKKTLALSTVCNDHLHHYRSDQVKDADWKKLKQCKYCKKFLIAKKVTRQFCDNNDKCHDAYNNRKAIRSGKRKAFMKKKRLEGKYQ